MTQSQIINNLEKFKDFFACRILLDADHQQPGNIKDFFACKTVLAANHHYPENIQRLFRLQNCLGRRSSITRKYSKTFSPADLSQSQIINNLEKFKDFFACRSLLDVDHQQPGNNQRFFSPQNCLSRRSSIPRKYANSFSPADVSWQQIIFIQKIFKDFFACKTVLAADHRCPGNIQTLFHLQIWLNRKSSTTWKNLKTFSPAEMSQPQIINNLEIIKDFFACKTVLAPNHHFPENIQRLFRLQNFLRRRSSTTWEYSKTFSPADLPWPQVIDTPKILKDFFTCRIVLAANDQQHGNIQIFSTCRTLLAANHQQPGNSPRHFHRQKYLSLKLSTTWKRSKFFFACRNVLAANHQQPGNNQELFRLQNCLGSKSSISRKHSSFFSASELPWPQIINIMEIFKSFPNAELS